LHRRYPTMRTRGPLAAFLPASLKWVQTTGFVPLHSRGKSILTERQNTNFFSRRKKDVMKSNVVGLFMQRDSFSSNNNESGSRNVAKAEEENSTLNNAPYEYQSLLQDVGLDGKLSQVQNLPSSRTLSANEVFCNRELNLSGIRAIGFDMDYTLLQYKQPAFDMLAFEGAKDKLVNVMGYPPEVLDLKYDHELWVRGLIIDIQRGNFLKIDRHKYVRMAYHGFSPISSSNRKMLYNGSFNKIPSFTEKHFINMDTLFQFVDAHLFAHMITLKDQGNYDVLDLKTYEEMYKEIRECIDLCHRDGVIKEVVAINPDKYLVTDDRLIPMLKGYRDAGVKIFLLTNSYWEYTSVAMNYLFHGRKVNDELKNKNEWLDLFDIVIVGSCKPAYLIDLYLNLFRVKPEDGSLLNTDGLYEIAALGENGALKFLSLGKVFQGGNWQHLQGMLEIEAGEEILYVGDHLYSDVLRSKRTLGWRTALIVPEIEKEMTVFSELKFISTQIVDLRKLREELSLYGDMLRRNPETPKIKAKLDEIQNDDKLIKDKLALITKQYHLTFHPIWGQLFLAGYQDSRFAYYVQNYACLYTSRATNLGLVSTSRSFRTSGEMLPHDKLMLDASSSFHLNGIDS